MDYSKHLYTATDVAKVIELATGRNYPLSMLSYFIRQGLVVPRQGHKNKPNYYEFYQVVYIYILRFLKEYGVPATRIQDVMTRKFMTVLRNYCNGKLEALPGSYIVCSETLITLCDLEDLLKEDSSIIDEFFWCLPLNSFKADITDSIENLITEGQIAPIKI